MARSEADMIAKAPVKVKLGQDEYEVKPLPIIKSREWRTHFNEVMGKVIEPMDGQFISHSLTAALVAFPEKVAELLFSYAGDLPKEKILDEATEEQLNVAFGQVMQLAYPFLASFQSTLQVVKSQ